MSWNNVIPWWMLDEKSLREHLEKIKGKKRAKEKDRAPKEE